MNDNKSTYIINEKIDIFNKKLHFCTNKEKEILYNKITYFLDKWKDGKRKIIVTHPGNINLHDNVESVMYYIKSIFKHSQENDKMVLCEKIENILDNSIDFQ